MVEKMEGFRVVERCFEGGSLVLWGIQAGVFPSPTVFSARKKAGEKHIGR